MTFMTFMCIKNYQLIKTPPGQKQKKKVNAWVYDWIIIVVIIMAWYMFGNSSSNPNLWSV